MSSKTSKKDIAIVGISGKFPKSENIQKFWQNLEKAEELIRFFSESELAELGVSEDKINDPNYVRSSSRIDNPESFDHAFFGYTREEAALMDPQIRVLHEEVWKGLEDAGYNPENDDEKIGCFFSASDNINWRTHVMLTGSSHVNPFFANSISNITSISRLISYSLNLQGPSYFLDTACSSSLVAIHLACRNLLLKECSMAVAGGVSISSATDVGYHYEAESIFSSDGHCRAFDKEGNGTLSGEGVGVVVLKRLEDALQNNDHIYAVIKSTAVNNDGKGKVGYTAPSVQGQYDCIKLAQQIAGVEPSEIGYIEAHGTGTKLGDPIEIEALNKAFNYDSSHKCAIGSVKTNMGHLDAAAGVAGLIKAALTVYQKTIPASLHFNEPNPQINFHSGPFYVNTMNRPWESEKERYAAVSSFGIGGTNAHAILGEAPPHEDSDPSTSFQLIPLAAQTQTSIATFKKKLTAYLKDHSTISLSDLSYTLLSRRNNYRYKEFLVVQTREDLLDSLEKLGNTRKAGTLNDRQVVFMFAGQGSQYFQMGKDLYDEFPFFQSIVDNGLEILAKETHLDFRSVLGYNSDEPANSEKINQTVYTQPLMFLLMYASAKLLEQVGIKPSQMIGHSLGEYVAACLGGVFSFEDALTLVQKRAELMNTVERGTMLHVQLTATEVEARLPKELAIAAINTHDSCVVSGNSTSIETFNELLKKEGVITIPLTTSHAFHSEMMDEILDEFYTALQKCTLSPSQIPYVSCKTGKPITEQEATSSNYWVKHLRETVVFADGLNFLLDQGFSTFIEIGSSKTLSNFLHKQEQPNKQVNLVTVSRHPKEKGSDVNYFLRALGGLWQLGVSINWSKYFEGQKRRKLVVPGYAFDAIQFPARVNPLKQLADHYNGNGGATFAELTSEIAHSMSESVNEIAENGLDERGSVEKPELTSTHVSATSETEKELVALWEALFGYEGIGIDDDFFELGGDSLKALTLLKRIHQTFDVEIRVEEFFERCSIRVLANEVELAVDMRKLNADTTESSNSEQLRF